MQDQMQVILDSLREFWMQLSSFLPQLIGALVILIVGWLIAKIVRNVAERFLKMIKIDTAAEKAGIEDFLKQGGVQFSTVGLIANIFYWFIMFTVILAVLNSLNLRVAAELFNKIILYLPNVFVAVIVLVFGTMFARFIRGAIATYLKNVGMEGVELMSSIAMYAVIVFVSTLALEQLAIGGEILVSAFQIAFGALCLGLALAFGLGGRDWAARILEKTWKK